MTAKATRAKTSKPRKAAGASVPVVPMTFVSADPPADAAPFPIAVSFSRAVGEDPETGARDWQEVTETFLCRSFVSGGVLLNVEGLFAGSVSAGVAALPAFFDAAFLPVSAERWRQVQSAPDVFITARAVTDVALALWRRYAS